uniref:HEP200 protein n=1 Tax=Cylindrotheca fusiformis TaxID=2853 RepID=UPI003704D51E
SYYHHHHHHQPSDLNPSSQPSECADVLEECPIDECFLPYSDASRPPSCLSFGRPDCDVLPTPQNINCPRCCATECRPDNPMFTPSPDGSPPICSPTMLPTNQPTPPEPSSAPSDCGEVIEECPLDTCFLPTSDPARPPDCTAVGRPDCDVLPFPNNLGCPACCPFECSPDNPMFTPSPDGSPPNCSPTMLPTPQPSTPTVITSPAPSSQPSQCAEVIEQCPIDECFLPYGDSSRPLDCTDPAVNRPDCDVLPTPQNINCPACCAFECRPDNPMFTPSPDGSPPICSPTMMPSPEPSSQPSDCGEVIEECPIDACFLPKSDSARPPDCTAVGRPDCNVLPFPNNIGCPSCCPFECSPDNPMFTPSPDGSPPNCSPTMLPSPSPSAVTVPLTPAPSSAPTRQPSSQPTGPQPSSQPSECADVLELCPYDTCFLPFDDSSRPPDCTDPSVNRPDCDKLSTAIDFTCPTCCPTQCRPDNPMFSPSPDGSPPVCSPTMMPSPLPSPTE